MDDPREPGASIRNAERFASWGIGTVEVHGLPLGSERLKVPVGEGWQRSATTSPPTIRERIARQHGQYGLRVMPHSRAVGLDVDQPETFPWELLPPGAVIVRHGGRNGSAPDKGHVWLRLPEGYPADRVPSKLPWGEIANVRQRQLVGPGSVHPDGTLYTIVSGPLPDELPELEPQAAEELLGGQQQGDRPPRAAEDWTWGSEMGSRHQLLVSRVRKWRGDGLSARTMRQNLDDYLERHAIPRTHDGRTITDAELDRLVAWAFAEVPEDGPETGRGFSWADPDQGGPEAAADGRAGLRAADTQLSGDTRTAARFVARVGDSVRWDNTNLRWLIWSERGKRWEVDTRGAIKDIWRRVLEQAYSEALKVADDRERKVRLSSLLAASASDSRYESGLKLARSRVPVRTNADDWDRDPWLLGVGNGVVDLRTGLLLPDPKPAMVSRSTRAPYDPAARAPTFLRFIGEVFGGGDRDEVVDWLQLAFGYSIIGIADEEVIVFAYGVGANGKTTLMEALSYTLGAYAGPMETEAVVGSRRGTGGTNEDTVALRGLRLAIAFEPPIGAHLNEKNLKRIASRDPLTAALKYGRRQEWLPTHTPWLLTNSLPTVSDPTDATWRRIIALPFLEQWDKDGTRLDLPRADTNLRRKLEAEAEGILAWLVAGAVRYAKTGTLQPFPARVRMAREAYRGDEDAVARFVREMVTDDDDRTGKRPLWQAYQAWCELEGVAAYHRSGERDFRSAFPTRYRDVFGHEVELKTIHGTEMWWPVAVRPLGLRDDERHPPPGAPAAPGETRVVEGGGSEQPLLRNARIEERLESPTTHRHPDPDEAAEGPVLSTNGTGGGGQRVACADYSAHQSSHRNTPDGWVCDACPSDPGSDQPC